MGHLKARLLALLLVAIGGGLVAVNWYRLLTAHDYYPKLAIFAPVVVVGGLFLLLFPGMWGRPETTRSKVIVLLVFGLGVLAGLINLYLMDPSLMGLR